MSNITNLGELYRDSGLGIPCIAVSYTGESYLLDKIDIINKLFYGRALRTGLKFRESFEAKWACRILAYTPPAPPVGGFPTRSPWPQGQATAFIQSKGVAATIPQASIVSNPVGTNHGPKCDCGASSVDPHTTLHSSWCSAAPQQSA